MTVLVGAAAVVGLVAAADDSGDYDSPSSSYTCSDGTVVEYSFECPSTTTSRGGDDPTQPPADTGVGRIVAADGISQEVYSSASLSAEVLGTYDDGGMIEILCTERGDPVVNGEGISSSLWNRTEDGYVPDVFVETGTMDAVAPSC